MLESQELKEDKIDIDDITVNYKTAGEGQAVFVLHGWGSSSDSWTEVQMILADKGYRVIIPDLPGFGKTAAPSIVWGVEEYADFVQQCTEQLELEKFIVVGHSFGGQIAIQFAVMHSEKIDKLILVAAAGVRRTPGFAKKLVMAVAKMVSLLLYLIPFRELRANVRSFLYMAIRRKDYVRTQGIMRDVFKKVITQDLTAKFSKISAPTLIVWGDQDELTPVQDAYLMDELIPNSQLEVIEDGKHALNFQLPEKLSKVMLDFLQE